MRKKLGWSGSRDKVREPKKGKAPITDAIYEAGFGSSSRLYEKSSAALGMTPRVMREGGAGLLIRYTTAASPLGRMLVATTDVGICSIAFGKDDKELVAELRERFSKAQLVPAKGNTGWLADAVAFVTSQLGEHPLAATFPLDVRATAFQQRVWKALQEIPRGETRSYSELAASWVCRRLRARWVRRLDRILWRWWCLAIGRLRRAVGWAGITGAWSGSGSCWRRRDDRHVVGCEVLYGLMRGDGNWRTVNRTRSKALPDGFKWWVIASLSLLLVSLLLVLGDIAATFAYFSDKTSPLWVTLLGLAGALGVGLGFAGFFVLMAIAGWRSHRESKRMEIILPTHDGS